MDKAKQFIVWLDGFLDGHETLDETKTAKLKEKLDGIFDHDAMDAITSDKPTLEQLGEEHNFNVSMFPPFGHGLDRDGLDGEKLRC